MENEGFSKMAAFCPPDAAYLEPPHVVLCTVEGLTAPEMITTAVYWILEKSPVEVPVRKVPLTDDLRASVEAAEQSVHSDQILIFLGMAGLMVLGKEVRLSGNNANYKYLSKRWQALCATEKIEDIFTTRKVSHEKYMEMIGALEKWQLWMKSRDALRRSLLDAALINFPESASLLRKAAIAQVKMVLKNFGLKSVLIMDEFVPSVPNRAILIHTVAEQAVQLRRAIQSLRQLHGEKFAFIKVYPLEGANQLNHKTYPDLYYAALTTVIRKNQLGPGGKYVLTNVQTLVRKRVIDGELKLKFKRVYKRGETTVIKI